MTDVQRIKLQEWWKKTLVEITRKVMQEEEKRQERIRKKNASMLADFGIESLEDIDELYGYGAITEKKRDKLTELFEASQTTDEMYEAKIALLQDAYNDAVQILNDLGQGSY